MFPDPTAGSYQPSTRLDNVGRWSTRAPLPAPPPPPPFQQQFNPRKRDRDAAHNQTGAQSQEASWGNGLQDGMSRRFPLYLPELDNARLGGAQGRGQASEMPDFIDPNGHNSHYWELDPFPDNFSDMATYGSWDPASGGAGDMSSRQEYGASQEPPQPNHMDSMYRSLPPFGTFERHSGPRQQFTSVEAMASWDADPAERQRVLTDLQAQLTGTESRTRNEYYGAFTPPGEEQEMPTTPRQYVHGFCNRHLATSSQEPSQGTQQQRSPHMHSNGRTAPSRLQRIFRRGNNARTAPTQQPSQGTQQQRNSHMNNNDRTAPVGPPRMFDMGPAPIQQASHSTQYRDPHASSATTPFPRSRMAHYQTGLPSSQPQAFVAQPRHSEYDDIRLEHFPLRRRIHPRSGAALWAARTCIGCMEKGDGSPRAELECGHVYCADCFKNAFQASLNSRTPFLCCGYVKSIDGVLATRFLDKDFRENYKRVFADLRNPKTGKETQEALDRRSDALKEQEGRDERAALEMALGNGWTQCPQCKHLIERVQGCRMMTCRCGAEFNYRGTGGLLDG